MQRPLAEKTPWRYFRLTKFILSETEHDRRLVTIKHGHKVGFGLSETAKINHLQRPLAEKTPRHHFGLTKNLLISNYLCLSVTVCDNCIFFNKTQNYTRLSYWKLTLQFKLQDKIKYCVKSINNNLLIIKTSKIISLKKTEKFTNVVRPTMTLTKQQT